MDQKQLADELRQGHAWRFADGLRVSIGGKYDDKTKANDWELVKAASTCNSCGKSATNEEISEAVADAHDYKSFATLIAPCLEHAHDCIFDPDEEEYGDDEAFEDEDDDESIL